MSLILFQTRQTQISSRAFNDLTMENKEVKQFPGLVDVNLDESPCLGQLQRAQFVRFGNQDSGEVHIGCWDETHLSAKLGQDKMNQNVL